MEKLVKTEIVEMPSNNNLLELAAVKIEVEKIKREVVIYLFQIQTLFSTKICTIHGVVCDYFISSYSKFVGFLLFRIICRRTK